jgi:hypothetical protein
MAPLPANDAVNARMRATMPAVTLPPEIRVLCALASRRARESGAASFDAGAGVDWDGVLAAAAAHGVTDLLLAPLASSASPVPAPVLDTLGQRALEVTGLNLNRATQLVELLGLLSAHGIRALTFKGPALAAGIYGHLSRRTSSDLDILVHRRDVARVRPLLLAHGYTLPFRVRHRGGSLAYGLLPGAGRDDTLWPGQQWQTSVDVHVAFAYWTLGMRLDTRELFDRSVTVDIAGHAIATLCPDDLLLVLAIHGMMHGWPTLRFASDVDAAAALVDDWSAVMRRAKAAGMSRVLWVALLLARDLLETTLPPQVAARVAEDPDAVAIVRAATTRMFDPGARTAEWDPGPWLLAFVDGRGRRLGVHARTLVYEWFLKWPWDAWLGRRGETRA